VLRNTEMEEEDPEQSSFLPPFANEENKELDRFIKVRSTILDMS
jgi:hypothetical protein